MCWGIQCTIAMRMENISVAFSDAYDEQDEDEAVKFALEKTQEIKMKAAKE